MSIRRWQPPQAVIHAAKAAPYHDNLDIVEKARLKDLTHGLPVALDTLTALIASSEPVIAEWAQTIRDKAIIAEQAHVTDVLVSSGFDEFGCTPNAYGILDPGYDGERIVALVRNEPRWQQMTAAGWEDCRQPDGMPYLELRGNTLAEAVEAISAGASLLLHPAQPLGWLPTKTEPTLVAAGAVATPPDSSGATGVYAIVDPLNTSAILSLFHVAPGPVISVRTGGTWVPDDGTLHAQLTGLNPPPVVAVPPDQVPDVLRQADDFDATHPQTAAGPAGGAAPSATAPAAPAAVAASVNSPMDGTDEPSVAGLCVHAADTGRVFMLQRGLRQEGDEPDPAEGTWEWPGGKAEPNDANLLETAMREWEEETGQALPASINNPAAQSWDSANGIYRGFVHVVPQETDINLADHQVGTNPDDPDGDTFEAVAWWNPQDIVGNPSTRSEVKNSMHQVHIALESSDPAVVASVHHARRVRLAKDADSAFDANRAGEDQAEQQKRRQFETMIASRHAALTNEGMDDSEAVSVTRREIMAEDARRDQWEKHRSDALLMEKERRLRTQPDVRASQELVQRKEAITADAVPHTLLPPQLFKYWVAGKGAVKIHWGIKGDWQRCRDHLTKYVKSDYQTKALCAELHKFATGRWTGSKANKEIEGHGL